MTESNKLFNVFIILVPQTNWNKGDLTLAILNFLRKFFYLFYGQVKAAGNLLLSSYLISIFTLIYLYFHPLIVQLH